MSVRTRFAPSPTGYLHIGGVRTALFNWLYARHCGGTFILRIEDTDRERSTDESVQAILDGMAWMGLDYDEGPIYQTGRLERYQKVIDQLLDAGKAYRCYCTKEELDKIREEQRAQGIKPRYNRHCRDRHNPERPDARPVIRFKNPLQGSVAFDDAIRGKVVISNDELDDLVIARTNGGPTYNFAVVVDDIDMEITHVIRGVGHLSNTPKQVLLFQAFEAATPVFAHLPTVLGSDGRKLSKRAGATPVNELESQGYSPDAVLNYLSLLGWSHPEEKEVLTRAELVAAMSLDRVGKSDTQMDAEKLLWVCQQHLAMESLEDLTDHVGPFIDRDRFAGLDADASSSVDALRTRLLTYGNINEHLGMLFPEDEVAAVSIRREVGADAEARAVLTAVRARLEALESWQAETLNDAVRAGGGDAGARGAGLFHPLRLVLIGAEKGPDVGKLLAGVGKTEAFRRIDEALS